MLLNANLYENTNELLLKIAHAGTDGFHPSGSNTPAFPVIHEMGHLVNDWLTGRTRVAIRDDGKLRPISVITNKWIREHVGNMELSRYSLVDHSEAWAEGFASLYLNKNLTPYAQELKKFLDRVTDMSKWVAIK